MHLIAWNIYCTLNLVIVSKFTVKYLENYKPYEYSVNQPCPQNYVTSMMFRYTVIPIKFELFEKVIGYPKVQ